MSAHGEIPGAGDRYLRAMIAELDDEGSAGMTEREGFRLLCAAVAELVERVRVLEASAPRASTPPPAVPVEAVPVVELVGLPPLPPPAAVEYAARLTAHIRAGGAGPRPTASDRVGPPGRPISHDTTTIPGWVRNG